MRKRLTFEERANLGQTPVYAPPRLPNHADVHGNPFYQQFMRLTQVYEEDERLKRQQDLADFAARMGNPILGNGFRPQGSMPPTPYRMDVGGPPTQVYASVDGSPASTAGFFARGAGMQMATQEEMAATAAQRRREMEMEQAVEAERQRQQQAEQRAGGVVSAAREMTSRFSAQGIASMSRTVGEALERVGTASQQFEAATGMDTMQQGLAAASSLLMSLGGTGYLGPVGEMAALGIGAGMSMVPAVVKIGDWLSRAFSNPQSLNRLGDQDFQDRVRMDMLQLHEERLDELQRIALEGGAEGQQAAQQYQREVRRQQLIEQWMDGDDAQKQEASRQLREMLEQDLDAPPPASPELTVWEQARNTYERLKGINPALAFLTAIWMTQNPDAAKRNIMTAELGDKEEALQKAWEAVRDRPEVQMMFPNAEVEEISEAQGSNAVEQAALQDVEMPAIEAGQPAIESDPYQEPASENPAAELYAMYRMPKDGPFKIPPLENPTPENIALTQARMNLAPEEGKGRTKIRADELPELEQIMRSRPEKVVINRDLYENNHGENSVGYAIANGRYIRLYDGSTGTEVLLFYKNKKVGIVSSATDKYGVSEEKRKTNRKIYQAALELQPQNLRELAAVRDLVYAEEERQGNTPATPTNRTPPATPRPKTPKASPGTPAKAASSSGSSAPKASALPNVPTPPPPPARGEAKAEPKASSVRLTPNPQSRR